MKKKDKTQEPVSPDAEPAIQPGNETSPDAPAPASDADGGQDARDSHLAELARLQDQYLRMRADFDNYKKRVARDLAETVKNSNKDLIESILPALDHFFSAEIMMESKGAEAATYLEGFRMVRNELMRVLEANGLKSIPALGEIFDPAMHEAIAAMPAASPTPPGTILNEVRKGYTLNNRVLRHSHVVVAAESEPEKNASASDDAPPAPAEPDPAAE